MASLLYSILLRLLPRSHRERYGAEMAATFAAMRSDARRRGLLGVAALWARECRNVVALTLRDRGGRSRAGSSESAGGRAGTWLSECRWALRAVQARRWQTAFVVSLMGVALAVNATLFAVADSLAFSRVGYPGADRIVTLQGRNASGQTITGMPLDLIAPWRTHKDLFSDVHGESGGTVLLNRDGTPIDVRAASVTPGLLEMVGGAPIAGRLFNDADREPDAATLAIIREDLARDLFGTPEQAVGRRLDAVTGPLHVVGVLPNSFRFPSGIDRLWRMQSLSPRADGRVPSLLTMARLAPGASLDAVNRALGERSPAVVALTTSRRPWKHTVTAEPITGLYSGASTRVFWFLVGAALCLLLTACASVASVELASAVARARSYAIASAMGASRASLVRMVMAEAAMLAGAAAGLALGLASLATAYVASTLPESMTYHSTNPINVDVRTMAFMAAAGLLTWIVTALPVIVFASRPATGSVLRLDARTGAGSRGASAVRRGLTSLQVAAAVCLLIGATLGTRSYIALLTQDAGFDAGNVVSLEVTLPPSLPRTPEAIETTSARVLQRLRAMPDVRAATSGAPPPIMDGDRHAAPLEVEGATEPAGMVVLISRPATPSYFDTLGVPMRAGQTFTVDNADGDVVVSETFARQFFPDGAAVGRRFRQQGDRAWRRIVGVSARTRNESDRLGQPSAVEHEIYTRAEEPSLTPRSAADVETMPTFARVSFSARLRDGADAASVARAVRDVDPQLLAKVEPVGDLYDLLNADSRVATSVMSSFGVLALAIALAGVYGVMAFLVAGRRRELAIRMALGAARRDVVRHVLGSALRFVVAGAALGLGAAWMVSRVIASQLFGVSPTDAATYAGVSALVIVAAILATLLPARRAARVDPALALRAE